MRTAYCLAMKSWREILVIVFLILPSALSCRENASTQIPPENTNDPGESNQQGQPQPVIPPDSSPEPPSPCIPATLPPHLGEASIFNIVLDPEIDEPTHARAWHRSDLAPSGAGVVFVSGVDGGYEEPVDGAYQRLAHRLAERGVPSLFVDYRSPGEIKRSTEDAVKAARFLLKENCISRIAFVGWSFGGAVIAHAASQIPQAQTLIGIAPQSLNAEPYSLLRPPQSVLLIHSVEDENVPFYSSEQIRDELPPELNHELVRFESGDHHLSGMASEVDPILFEWLEEKMALDGIRRDEAQTPAF